MARYRVIAKSLIGGRIRNPGEEVNLGSTTLPGMALEPLDDEARALKAEALRLRAVTVPEGSSTEHALTVELHRHRPMSEAEWRAMYAKGTPPPPELATSAWSKAWRDLAQREQS